MTCSRHQMPAVLCLLVLLVPGSSDPLGEGADPRTLLKVIL